VSLVEAPARQLVPRCSLRQQRQAEIANLSPTAELDEHHFQAEQEDRHAKAADQVDIAARDSESPRRLTASLTAPGQQR